MFLSDAFECQWLSFHTKNTLSNTALKQKSVEPTSL